MLLRAATKLLKSIVKITLLRCHFTGFSHFVDEALAFKHKIEK